MLLPRLAPSSNRKPEEAGLKESPEGAEGRSNLPSAVLR